MKLVLTLAAAILVSASQAGAQTASGWDRIAGAQSKISDKSLTTAVCRTSDEWKALWVKHTGVADSTPPAVDFEKEMVVGVFLGKREKAGYKLETKLLVVPSDAVDQTMDVQGPSLVVFYKEVAPAKNGFGATVMTAPFELRKVKKHANVAFERDTLYKAMGAIDTLRVFKDDPRFDR